MFQKRVYRSRVTSTISTIINSKYPRASQAKPAYDSTVRYMFLPIIINVIAFFNSVPGIR